MFSAALPIKKIYNERRRRRRRCWLCSHSYFIFVASRYFVSISHFAEREREEEEERKQTQPKTQPTQPTHLTVLPAAPSSPLATPWHLVSHLVIGLAKATRREATRGDVRLRRFCYYFICLCFSFLCLLHQFQQNLLKCDGYTHATHTHTQPNLESKPEQQQHIHTQKEREGDSEIRRYHAHTLQLV